MASQSDHAPSVTLSQALRGRYITGVVKFPLLVVAFWALGQWGIEVGLGLEEHAMAAGLGVLITETVMTLIERPFVLKHHHPDPGDRMMTVLVLVAPWLCWGALLWLTHGSSMWTLAAATLAAVIYTAFTLGLDQPWKQGLSRAEIAHKWQETKE